MVASKSISIRNLKRLDDYEIHTVNGIYTVNEIHILWIMTNATRRSSNHQIRTLKRWRCTLKWEICALPTQMSNRLESRLKCLLRQLRQVRSLPLRYRSSALILAVLKTTYKLLEQKLTWIICVEYENCGTFIALLFEIWSVPLYRGMIFIEYARWAGGFAC